MAHRVFVKRNERGKINGLYLWPKDGIPGEELQSDDPEVTAFNALSPEEIMTEEEAAQAEV